jgi:hypothetical protein
MATPQILSSPSLHAHPYVAPGSHSHSPRQPQSSSSMAASTSSAPQASQIPLPSTPSTPSRRRQREVEAADQAGRKKRVESAGGGGGGDRTSELNKAHQLLQQTTAPVIPDGLVDGKRIKELPYEYMDCPEQDLVILIGA